MPLRDIGGMVFGRDFPARHGGGRLFSGEEFDLISPTLAPLRNVLSTGQKQTVDFP